MKGFIRGPERCLQSCHSDALHILHTHTHTAYMIFGWTTTGTDTDTNTHTALSHRSQCSAFSGGHKRAQTIQICTIALIIAGINLQHQLNIWILFWTQAIVRTILNKQLNQLLSPLPLPSPTNKHYKYKCTIITVHSKEPKVVRFAAANRSQSIGWVVEVRQPRRKNPGRQLPMVRECGCYDDKRPCTNRLWTMRKKKWLCSVYIVVMMMKKKKKQQRKKQKKVYTLLVAFATRQCNTNNGSVATMTMTNSSK